MTLAKHVPVDFEHELEMLIFKKTDIISLLFQSQQSGKLAQNKQKTPAIPNEGREGVGDEGLKGDWRGKEKLYKRKAQD